MTQTPQQLKKQAQDKIEGKTLIIRRCKKRAHKWAAKMKKHHKSSPQYKRAQRKYIFWRRRQHEAIYLKHHWQGVLANAIKKLADNTGLGQKLVNWAASYNGVREGSPQHRAWVTRVGGSVTWPWCSIFVANGIMAVYHWAKSELPDNPAYSGVWASWKHGKRVSIRKRNKKPGRLGIYDWGDGGLTDHVAILDGHGSRWGGNQDDAVNKRPEDAQFLVFVVEVRSKS